MSDEGVNSKVKKKPGPRKGEWGRPPYKRDETVAFQVALFVGTGCKLEAIAYRFKISVETLKKYYKPEIEEGSAINELFWVGSLAAAARKGNVSAIQFALARKYGWMERTEVRMVDDGEDGIIFDTNKQPATDDDDTDEKS